MGHCKRFANQLCKCDIFEGPFFVCRASYILLFAMVGWLLASAGGCVYKHWPSGVKGVKE